MKLLVYHKPEYFDFIKHSWNLYIKKWSKEYVDSSASLVEDKFIGMIRGILDAKYNE